MRVYFFFVLRKCVHVYAWHGDNPHRNAWDSKKLSTTRIVENDRLSRSVSLRFLILRLYKKTDATWKRATATTVARIKLQVAFDANDEHTLVLFFRTLRNYSNINKLHHSGRDKMDTVASRRKWRLILMIYDSIKYVQGNRSLPSRVRPRRKILVARYVRTLTTPKCDVTKYVEERRIRKGCERQRDGVCIGVDGCARVCVCV